MVVKVTDDTTLSLAKPPSCLFPLGHHWEGAHKQNRNNDAIVLQICKYGKDVRS